MVRLPVSYYALSIWKRLVEQLWTGFEHTPAACVHLYAYCSVNEEQMLAQGDVSFLAGLRFSRQFFTSVQGALA
jgi:hypothetical protein